MKTTTLIAEMIVIGFQTIIWIVLFSVDDLSMLKVWGVEMQELSTVIAVVLVLMSYTLGVIVDAFTSAVEGLFEGPLGSEKRAELKVNHPEVALRLSESNMQLRLLRSTTFNLVLAAIAVTLRVMLWDWSPYTLLIWVVAIACCVSWLRRRVQHLALREAIHGKIG